MKDGRTVFAKGYGVRAAGRPETVDADTLFGIGSNTKAFTVAALAMLVDEGKLAGTTRSSTICRASGSTIPTSPENSPSATS